jgi:hypothetical protein
MSTCSPTDSWLGGSCTSETMTDIGEGSERLNSALSTRSLYSNNSDESFDEQDVKDVTDDLNEMLLEVENLRKSQTIYETSNDDLQAMIKDAGRISKRNSDIMSEDFDIFSLGEKDFLKADQDWAKKRYSSHLMPTASPLSRVAGIKKALSTEVIANRRKETKDENPKEHDYINANGSLLHSGHGQELDDQMKSNNPWDVDEKVGGTTHTLKVRK